MLALERPSHSPIIGLKIFYLFEQNSGYAAFRPFMFFDQIPIFDLFCSYKKVTCTSSSRIYFHLKFTSTSLPKLYFSTNKKSNLRKGRSEFCRERSKYRKGRNDASQNLSQPTDESKKK